MPVGVPLSTPADESESPAGNALNVLKVIVPNPPDCVNVWLKGVFIWPVVVAGLVTVIAWQLITKVYVDPTPVHPLLSIAVTTIGKVPNCVGVPLNTPAEDKPNPVGNVLEVV